MKKEHGPVTRLDYDLTSFSDGYPTGVIAYHGEEPAESEYCSTEEEFRDFTNKMLPECTITTEVRVILNPKDIGESTVTEFAKRIGSYAQEKINQCS